MDEEKIIKNIHQLIWAEYGIKDTIRILITKNRKEIKSPTAFMLDREDYEVHISLSTEGHDIRVVPVQNQPIFISGTLLPEYVVVLPDHIQDMVNRYGYGDNYSVITVQPHSEFEYVITLSFCLWDMDVHILD